MNTANASSSNDVNPGERYRKTMASHLAKSCSMIKNLLHDADFGNDFPHVMGHSSEEDGKMAIANECAILLKKAHLHVVAALSANRDGNLHSLAVHMRVVLECAMWLMEFANAAYHGTEEQLTKILNRTERDFYDTTRRMSRGGIDENELQKMIDMVRDTSIVKGKKPTRVTITDKVSQMVQGKSWYDHISQHFCCTPKSDLDGPSFLGGVLSANTEKDNLAFAMFLDYLCWQANMMLLCNGFLLVAVNRNDQPFNDALLLLEHKRTATANCKDALRTPNTAPRH